MKLVAVLAALSIAGCCYADWQNLYLKFDLLLDGYFPISLTQGGLLHGKWTYMTTDISINVDFYSYGKDPRVSIGYDVYGNIAGVRVAYVISDLTKKADENGVSYNYTFADKPIYSNDTYWGVDVHYTTVLFVSPEILIMGGREETDGDLADDIYVKINGTYVVMPRQEGDAPGMGFVKQGCFDGMGQHYFLGLSNTTADCNDLEGVFLLYENGALIGMGLTTFGSFTNGGRHWFESPPVNVIETIVPDRPECLTQWSTDYGTTGLHLFFKKHPRLTFCW